MKKFLTFLTLLTLFTITASAGTIVFAELGLENGVQYSDPFDGGDFTVTFGGGGNNGKYYNTGQGIRVYANGTMTFAAKTGNITEITITSSSTGNYMPSSNNATISSGSISTSGTTTTWTGNANNVVFTRGTQSDHWRIQSVTVTVSGGSTSSVEAPVITLNPATGPYYVGSTVTASISCETEDATLTYSLDNGNTWQSYNNSAVTIPSTTAGTVKIIAKATLDGDDATAEKTVTFVNPPTTFDNLAAVNGCTDNTEFIFTAPTVVMGAYNKNMYIVMQDNSAGTLINANSNWSADYTFGKIINADWSGKKETWYQKPRVINPADFVLSGQTAEVTPIVVSSDEQLTLANYGKYAVMKNVTVDDNGNISGITTTYNQFGLSFTNFEAGKYDVYGVVGYHSGAGQFMPLEYKEVPSPKYYLYGTFNNWLIGDENYKFTIDGDNTYSLNNVELPANVRFKIAKVVGSNNTEYGASNGGEDYGINGGWHTNLPMDGADAYTIASSGKVNITLTIDEDNSANNKFDVEKTQLYIRGSFDGWSENGVEMTTTETGWTYTRELAGGAGFGFVDGWGDWHGRDWLIKEEHLGQNIPIETSNNYTVQDAGEYTIVVNKKITSLVVTKQPEAAGNVFELVTDASDPDKGLVDGGEYIIVGLNGSDGYAMADQKSSNRNAKSITLNGNKAIIDDTIEIISLEEGTGDDEGTWYLYASKINTGYLYASSGSSNQLKTEATKDANAKAVITINDDNEATIVFQGTNTRNKLRFNYNNGAPLFNCYNGTTGTLGYLYKATASNRSEVPVITPESQTIKGGKVTVTITAAQGAAIYYTTDGSIPTIDPTKEYNGPFEVSSTGGRKVVTAIAVEGGKDASYPVSVTYLFTSPDAPVFDPADGTVRTEAFTVTISSEYEDAEIYYMLDPETAPTATILYNEVNLYDEPVEITSGTHTIYALVYLNGIKSDVVSATYSVAESKTLAELCGSGVDGKVYTISDADGLLGVYKNGNTVWFKDEIEKTFELANETLTIIGGSVNLDVPGNEQNYWIENIRTKDFDQSNWIEVDFTNVDIPTEVDGQEPNVYIKNLTGTYRINNGKRKLVLTKTPATAEVTAVTNPDDAYKPNPYIPANFYGSQQGYFFSKPKVQEYAKVVDAKWNGTKMVMGDNNAGFKGSFTIEPVEGLTVGNYYTFHGIINRSIAGGDESYSTPRLQAEGDYDMITTDLAGQAGSEFTAISTVGVNGEVKSVKYVSVAGVVSDRPFQGVNIVVTEYTDGTRTTAKVVK